MMRLMRVQVGLKLTADYAQTNVIIV